MYKIFYFLLMILAFLAGCAQKPQSQSLYKNHLLSHTSIAQVGQEIVVAAWLSPFIKSKDEHFVFCTQSLTPASATLATQSLTPIEISKSDFRLRYFGFSLPYFKCYALNFLSTPAKTLELELSFTNQAKAVLRFAKVPKSLL